MSAAFLDKGWVKFPIEPSIADWAHAARPVAQGLADDPDLQAQWLRCGETWFAGVNVFPNDADGSAPGHGVPPLSGLAVDFISDELGFTDFAWDAAQISVCYPGYPKPWDGESTAAFRFRRNRDAAHVDGLLRHGPERRRSLGEVHGFVLGLPLTAAAEGASPLVVWEGSHEIMRAAFRTRFAGLVPGDWSAEDITECYTAARRECFETCARVPVHAAPGEAYLVHRLALHGVSPWTAPDTGQRMIAYFRPDPCPGQMPDWWLARP